MAPVSALYRIHVETEESAYHQLELNGTAQLTREFRLEGDVDESPAEDVQGETYVDYWLEASQYVPIKLKYAQKLGDTTIRLLWANDFMAKTVISSTYLYHTLGSTTTPFAFNVVPATTNASFSSLASDTAYRYAVVDVQETLVLTVRDQFMNVQNHQTDAVTGQAVNLALSESLRTAADTVNANVTALEDGIWQLQYTLTRVSSLWNLSIMVQPNGAGPAYHVQGSPFTIVCQENVTAPVNTVISGDGATSAIAGNTTDFTVTLFDSGNNQRKSGGDQVAVTITAATGGTTSTAEGIEVFDREDGTYTIRYKVLDTSTRHLIKVTVNADSTNMKQSTLNVSSNITSPETSTFTSYNSTIGTPPGLAWPTTAAETIVNLTDAYTFNTSLKDAYSNPIKERVETLVTEIIGQGQAYYITATLLDLATGLYTSTFTVPTTGGRSTSLCG